MRALKRPKLDFSKITIFSNRLGRFKLKWSAPNVIGGLKRPRMLKYYISGFTGKKIKCVAHVNKILEKFEFDTNFRFFTLFIDFFDFSWKNIKKSVFPLFSHKYLKISIWHLNTWVGHLRIPKVSTKSWESAYQVCKQKSAPNHDFRPGRFK